MKTPAQVTIELPRSYPFGASPAFTDFPAGHRFPAELYNDGKLLARHPKGHTILFLKREVKIVKPEETKVSDLKFRGTKKAN